MIARFWPVAGVVGENGAFYFAYDHTARKMERKYHPALKAHFDNSGRFDAIKKRVETELPGAAISAEQSFRNADLVIDFCEDIKALLQSDVARIQSIFEEEGAVAKVSSIQVNGWFGDYDKLSMSRAFLSDILGIDVDNDTGNTSVAFVGDSPNDAPMFGFFENSCGVANVAEFGGQLAEEPKWVASKKADAGFVEIAEMLLSAFR